MTRPDRPSESMTVRARLYLVILALGEIWFAAFCLLAPQTFQSSSYDGVKQALPVARADAMPLWGVVFVVAAVIAIRAVWTGAESLARWALMLSVILSGCMVGGFVAAFINGDLTGPAGPVLWAGLALRDLTMLRAPLRNPFEALTRRVLDEEG